MPLFGLECQSFFTAPPWTSRSASRSIGKDRDIGRRSLQDLIRYRFGTGERVIKLTFMPCSAFHFAAKPGKISFSNGSFMIENP